MEILTVMTWPLIACLALPWILVYYGLHIVRREIIFVDLALAQVAALGTCLGILIGHNDRFLQIPLPHPGLAMIFPHGNPLPQELKVSFSFFWSFGFTLVGAAIFTLTRPKPDRRVPQEALIGIVYVVAAAAGILLLSRSAEGNEELRRTLIGDVLLVSPGQVLATFGLYAGIGALHFGFRKQFLMLSFDPERAEAEGLAVRWWDFFFYALFGLVVTTFVPIGGVLLVFSYLIVPAVCANLLAQGIRGLLLIGWGTAVVASVAGLYLSYQFDLPTGAAIVCVLGAALIGTGLVARFRHKA